MNANKKALASATAGAKAQSFCGTTRIDIFMSTHFIHHHVCSLDNGLRSRQALLSNDGISIAFRPALISPFNTALQLPQSHHLQLSEREGSVPTLLNHRFYS